MLSKGLLPLIRVMCTGHKKRDRQNQLWIVIFATRRKKEEEKRQKAVSRKPQSCPSPLLTKPGKKFKVALSILKIQYFSARLLYGTTGMKGNCKRQCFEQGP